MEQHEAQRVSSASTGGPQQPDSSSTVPHGGPVGTDHGEWVLHHYIAAILRRSVAVHVAVYAILLLFWETAGYHWILRPFLLNTPTSSSLSFVDVWCLSLVATLSFCTLVFMFERWEFALHAHGSDCERPSS